MLTAFSGGQNCNLMAEAYVFNAPFRNNLGNLRYMHISSGAPAHTPSVTGGSIVVVHAVRVHIRIRERLDICPTANRAKIQTVS